MMKYFLLLVLLISGLAYSNDGAFYARGNQLVPITETDISVKKEILTVKKVSESFIEVTVYYEFFNPKKEKEVLVGFEAHQPEGDVDPTPRQGQHPYIRDFTVNMNGSILAYNMAYVEDSLYAIDGKVQSLDLSLLADEDTYHTGYTYVYYFNATFKPGLNKVTHTYTYHISSSVTDYYAFDYVLTAANRWANKQIDDFTLIVDMGECEEFNIEKTFFSSSDEWTLLGLGRLGPTQQGRNYYRDNSAMHAIIQKGNIVFQKTNFHPKGELSVWCNQFNWIRNEGEISTWKNQLPYSYFQHGIIQDPETELEKKILRNLPFARRGYIFKNKEILDFYSRQFWYLPNPNYNSDTQTLHPLEIEWLERFKND